MRKIKLIVTVAVIAGIASVLVWQYAGNASLRDDNDRLRQMLAELKQISEVSAPAPVDDTFTEEQRSELLKLRAEVTQLRMQTNQIAVLTEANQKLQTSLREARTQPRTAASQKKNPEDALPQDIHPKESWAYRGFSTPDATIESTRGATSTSRRYTFAFGVSPPNGTCPVSITYATVPSE